MLEIIDSLQHDVQWGIVNDKVAKKETKKKERYRLLIYFTEYCWGYMFHPCAHGIFADGKSDRLGLHQRFWQL